MNYEETVNYLYKLLPIFEREGIKAYKADLSNTINLCEYLDNPQNKFKSVHVAGTNGKGSTSHYLAAILQSAGYKTGLYTSPHLKDFRERFRINGQSVEKANIINFVHHHKDYIESLKPSFFELCVAMAFDFFASEKVDIAIIEVGLGGRLDSTNVIKPELSVITNIGFDHTDILGDTLPKIASEKAGIIKEKIPVVISEKKAGSKNVFIKKAKETNSEIIFASDNIHVKFKSNKNLSLFVDIFDKNGKLLFGDLSSQLIGKYQLKNICGVIQAVFQLRKSGFFIPDKAIIEGISNVCSITGLKGRFQVLEKKPLIICDTGHNEHGINEVVKHLKQLKVKRKFFILGFVKDKDYLKILQLFPKDGIFYFCQANSPRSLPAEVLLESAKGLGINGYSILSVNKAIEKVKEIAENDDLIYIGGSTFVVAEINNL